MWFSMRAALITASTVALVSAVLMSQTSAQPAGRSHPRIVGGEDATFAELPWQAAIVRRDAATNKPATRISCGATFVRPNILMTAAHCVVGGPILDASGKVVDYWQFTGNLSGWAVLNGSAKLDDPGMRVYDITDVIMHPRYSELGTDYDFALLRVKQSYRGKLVDILTPAENVSLAVGDTVQVSGWGRTAERGNTTADLQKLDVKVISRSQCNGSDAYDGRITERMLCAGKATGGQDSCSGDSGGPLTATISGVRRLVGVVSWGEGCARPNKFGVYGRLIAVRDWVLDAIAMLERADS